MELKHLTSHTLRSLLSLTTKKDELIKGIEEVETEIAKTLKGAALAAVEMVEAATPAKHKEKPASKPRNKGKRTAKKTNS
jgi:hypothetical protein